MFRVAICYVDTNVLELRHSGQNGAEPLKVSLTCSRADCHTLQRKKSEGEKQGRRRNVNDMLFRAALDSNYFLVRNEVHYIQKPNTHSFLPQGIQVSLLQTLSSHLHCNVCVWQ